MYVYLLTNKVNGKYYVGKTVNKNLRRYLVTQKVWRAKAGRFVGGMPIIMAIAKYGWDNFIVNVISTATSQEQLNNLERLWIIVLNARDSTVGYNIAVGGGIVGVPCSDVAKAKISAANKGRKPVGYIRTDEHRKQLSDRMQGNKIGRKITPEIAAQWRKSIPKEKYTEWSRMGAKRCHKALNILRTEGM